MTIVETTKGRPATYANPKHWVLLDASGQWIVSTTAKDLREAKRKFSVHGYCL